MRNGEDDHGSLLIPLDYKVRLRLSATARFISPPSPAPRRVFLHLRVSRQLLLAMQLCPKLCAVIVKSKDLFIFYTQLLTAK